MQFFLLDPHGTIPTDLVLDLGREGCPPSSGPPHSGESSLETVILLGDGADLEARVTKARETGGDAILITLRTGRDSGKSARMIRIGADDDLDFPITARELIFRARMISRLHGRERRKSARSGAVFGITIFQDGRAPEIDGVPLQLSASEGLILSCLLRNAGRPVSREALHEAITGIAGPVSTGRVTDVHVCNLRRKLRTALEGRAPRIQTERGLGYTILSPG